MRGAEQRFSVYADCALVFSVRERHALRESHVQKGALEAPPARQPVGAVAAMFGAAEEILTPVLATESACTVHQINS